MAIELITGRAGTPHVDSPDMRALYAEIVGEARYLLNDYDTGVAEMESANDCHLMPAELMVDGAHVRITGSGETVSIDNGSSSYDRVDVVALHYVSTGEGDSRVETISVEVVKGTPVDTGGDARDPTMPSGSATILDGSSDVYIPYVRVKLIGLTPQTPESMLPTVPMSLYEAGTAVWPVANGGTGATSASDALDNLGVWDYVSAKGDKAYVKTVAGTSRTRAGSKIVSISSGVATLFTAAQITGILGVPYNSLSTVITVSNGDSTVGEFDIAVQQNSSGAYILCDKAHSTSPVGGISIRVNYVILDTR